MSFVRHPTQVEVPPLSFFWERKNVEMKTSPNETKKLKGCFTVPEDMRTPPLVLVYLKQHHRAQADTLFPLCKRPGWHGGELAA